MCNCGICIETKAFWASSFPCICQTPAVSTYVAVVVVEFNAKPKKQANKQTDSIVSCFWASEHTAYKSLLPHIICGKVSAISLALEILYITHDER